MKTTPLFTLKKVQSEFPSIQISESKQSADFIRQFYFEDINVFESFFILTLSRRNETTGYAKISQGGICSTIVDIKLIAKYAVENLASGVILAHNHPSGNLRPSEQDFEITNKIVKALDLLDVKVLDHIILTESNYFSFRDNCYL
jgi:DNA repair protein RadC